MNNIFIILEEYNTNLGIDMHYDLCDNIYFRTKDEAINYITQGKQKNCKIENYGETTIVTIGQEVYKIEELSLESEGK